MKSILLEPRWWVGDSFGILCILISGSNRSVYSKIFAMPLSPWMNGSLESIHSITSWDRTINDLRCLIISSIILLRKFSYFCCLSSKISHCYELMVLTPWSSRGTQGLYIDMIVTYFLFLPRSETWDHGPNPSKSSPQSNILVALIYLVCRLMATMWLFLLCWFFSWPELLKSIISWWKIFVLLTMGIRFYKATNVDFVIVHCFTNYLKVIRIWWDSKTTWILI